MANDIYLIFSTAIGCCMLVADLVKDILEKSIPAIVCTHHLYYYPMIVEYNCNCGTFKLEIRPKKNDDAKD